MSFNLKALFIQERVSNGVVPYEESLFFYTLDRNKHKVPPYYIVIPESDVNRLSGLTLFIYTNYMYIENNIVLLNNNQWVILKYSLTNFNSNSGYLTILFSLNAILHLHSFKNNYGVASLYFLSYSYFNRSDRTR